MKQRYAPRIYKDDLSRLLGKAIQDGSCWLWTAARLPSGYGCFRFRGRQTYAHRASYTLHHGEIPDGFYVMHECDRPACINPCHLRAVPPVVNTRDMLDKGRHKTSPLCGCDNPRARLTADQVVEIRSLGKTTNPYRISKIIGVSRQTIVRVLNGESYASV
jgi:hypothetical protein